MALIAVASAFAAAANDQCTSIIDAITAGDYARAEGMTIKIYSQKSSCSAATLADLAVIYHKLTEKSTDPVTRYDYVLKTIDATSRQSPPTPRKPKRSLPHAKSIWQP